LRTIWPCCSHCAHALSSSMSFWPGDRSFFRSPPVPMLELGEVRVCRARVLSPTVLRQRSRRPAGSRPQPALGLPNTSAAGASGGARGLARGFRPLLALALLLGGPILIVAALLVLLPPL
jgi:hypothetical protein